MVLNNSFFSDVNFLMIIFSILGIIVILIIIFGFPRKKSERITSLEGIDDPAVAEAFEHVTNFLPFKMLRRKIVKRLKKMEPSGTLVDIGCGSGNLLIKIAENFDSLNLIGVDITDEMLDLAKQKSEEYHQGDRIKFKLGTAEKLPFSDNSVDFIVSTFSLHHWSNPINIFQEIFRVLTSDGKFLIFDFRRDARKFFYGLFHFATKIVVPKALKKVNEPLGSISASFTPEEVNQLFLQTYFQDITIKPYLAWMFIEGRKS